MQVCKPHYEMVKEGGRTTAKAMSRAGPYGRVRAMESDQAHELPRTSAPAARALAAAQITSLEELSRHPRSEIARLHGVGSKALQIWKAALDEHGMGQQW